jgi:uncharacterized protein YerC
MARVSHTKLDDKVLDKLFIPFFEIAGKKNTEADFMSTLKDLLSPNERVMIAKRIAIMYLLLKERDCLSICEVLKVSPATVYKFKFLMERSEGVVPTFNRILKNEKVTEFLEDIVLTLYSPGSPGINWSSAWHLKNKTDERRRRGI